MGSQLKWYSAFGGKKKKEGFGGWQICWAGVEMYHEFLCNFFPGLWFAQYPYLK